MYEKKSNDFDDFWFLKGHSVIRIISLITTAIQKSVIIITSLIWNGKFYLYIEHRQLEVENQLTDVQNKVERLTAENDQLKKDFAETGKHIHFWSLSSNLRGL